MTNFDALHIAWYVDGKRGFVPWTVTGAAKYNWAHPERLIVRLTPVEGGECYEWNTTRDHFAPAGCKQEEA